MVFHAFKILLFLITPTCGFSANLVNKIIPVDNRTWVPTAEQLDLTKVARNQQDALAKRLQIPPHRVIPLEAEFGGLAVGRSGPSREAPVRIVFLALSPHRTSEAREIASTRVIATSGFREIAALDLKGEPADVLEQNLVYHPQTRLNFRPVDQMPRALGRKLMGLANQVKPYLRATSEDPVSLTFEFTFEDGSTQKSPLTKTTEQTADVLDWFSPPTICERILSLKEYLPKWLK